MIEMANRDRFQAILDRVFEVVQDLDLSFVDVKSGDLHRILGGYPGPDHRMPICCDVMYHNMRGEDKVLEKPPKGRGASLIIRYYFPR